MTNQPDLKLWKERSAKYLPFVFLGAAIAFLAWIIFVLHCTPRQKFILLGSFAGLGILAFVSFKFENDGAQGTKPAPAAPDLEGVLNTQKTFLADEKIAAIVKFASVMAHELKNPLSSLKNISYYFVKAKKDSDPKTVHMMEMLSNEVDRTDRMITNISDIAHARRISKTATDVSALIDIIVTELKFEPGVEIKKEIEPGITANVDPERLAQALKNLIKNAKDAVAGKGLISVELHKVGTFFELSVKDSGPGIEPETLKQIFEPLFTTKNKSLGLGLNVVKEVIAGHGGKIDVDTQIGKGSTFRVFIPTEPAGQPGSGGNTPA